MKELSVNILDVTKNSVTAGAKNIVVSLVTDKDGWLTLTIKDDGCGMTDDVLKSVTDPFYTTRTTRRVGLGIPLFKLSAEQTGGKLTIASKRNDGKSLGHGTQISATYNKFIMSKRRIIFHNMPKNRFPADFYHRLRL